MRGSRQFFGVGGGGVVGVVSEGSVHVLYSSFLHSTTTNCFHAMNLMFVWGFFFPYNNNKLLHLLGIGLLCIN